MKSFKEALWISFLLLGLIGCKEGLVLSSSKIQKANNRDIFFEQVAREFKNPDVCGYITPNAYVIPSAFEKGSQIRYVRSSCYFYIAHDLRRSDLCKQVKAVSTLSLDGSYYSEKKCAEIIEGPPLKDPLYPNIAVNVLAEFLKQMGYATHSQVTNYVLAPDNIQAPDPNRTSMPYHSLYYYLLLRASDSEKQIFFQHLSEFAAKPPDAVGSKTWTQF